MSSQQFVQWNYITYFHIRGFLTTFYCSFWKRLHKFAWFVCFDRWLHRYQSIHPLTKYYYIIERVYLFIGCLYYLSVHFHSCYFYIQYHRDSREITFMSL